LESLSAFVWSTFILLLSSGHRSRITRWNASRTLFCDFFYVEWNA
jgi:hypothetical protein